MTQKEMTPGNMWEMLSNPQKEATMAFAVAEQTTGVGRDYVDAMGVEEPTLRDLMDRGIVEEKMTWEYFQDIADGLREQAAEIREQSTELYGRKLVGKDKDDEDRLEERYRVEGGMSMDMVAETLRLRKKTIYPMSDEDRAVLSDFDRADRLAKMKNEDPRYRIKDPKFCEYIITSDELK